MDVVGTDRYIRFSGRFKCTPQRFPIGQIVHHKMLEYRGVIYDVDPVFDGLEEWYERVAHSRLPKSQPWYHILVDGQNTRIYVAEPHLEVDANRKPVDHLLVENLFGALENCQYDPRYSKN